MCLGKVQGIGSNLDLRLRGASSKVKGKVYKACVQRVLIYMAVKRGRGGYAALEKNGTYDGLMDVCLSLKNF